MHTNARRSDQSCKQGSFRSGRNRQSGARGGKTTGVFKVADMKKAIKVLEGDLKETVKNARA